VREASKTDDLNLCLCVGYASGQITSTLRTDYGLDFEPDKRIAILLWS
jgi:hypothetical protein